MRIRFAIAADVPAILALDRSAPTSAHYSEERYQEMIAQGFNARSMDLLNAKRTGNLDELSRMILVSAEDSEVKAFLISRALGPEWEIENLVVAKAGRRKGVASQLLGELLKLARNRAARKVFLEVRESNAAARGLYEKLEFVESGRRRNYYHDPGEDAVLYTRELADCT
jgi:ribosomal-protein-alanine N-acetyltransferase